jgi:hypothetical protein
MPGKVTGFDFKEVTMAGNKVSKYLITSSKKGAK